MAFMGLSSLTYKNMKIHWPPEIKSSKLNELQIRERKDTRAEYVI